MRIIAQILKLINLLMTNTDFTGNWEFITRSQDLRLGRISTTFLHRMDTQKIPR